MVKSKDQLGRHRVGLIEFTIDHSAEPAFWIDPAARFVYVNQAACRWLGYTRDELLDMTVHDVYPDLPARGWREYWALINEYGSHVYESRHKARDGRILPVEIRVNHVTFEGREYHCAFVRDLTEQKQREQERIRMETQIRSVQKLESLGVLAGGLAHDFNNLLMAILGNADLSMITLPPDVPARRYIDEIIVASKRAAELCHQMLTYSGKGSMMVARRDLATVVAEMAPMLEAGLSKRIVLRYHFDVDVPEVMADESQMQQVVLNLVTNASESIGDDKGDIVVAIGVMQCDREFLGRCHETHPLPEGAYVFLEVADNGPGMDARTKVKMFDPFFTTKFVGRGLGLAAVSGIVRSHGGTIHVNSAPGEGTTIKVLLPAVASIPDDAASPAPVSAPAETTILLIDDDPHVREVGAEMLKLLGYQVMTTASGQSGIDLFEKYHPIIGCVIIGCTRPESIELETIDGLQSVDAALRLVLCSGHAEKEIRQSIGDRRFSAFLQKPYSLDALRGVLHGVLPG